jgi:hypothetical protein
VITITLALAGLIVGTSASSHSDREELKETWDEIIGLVCKQEVDKLFEFIDPRYGTVKKILGLNLGYFVKCDSFETISIKEQEGFCEVQMAFSLHGKTRNVVYYLVEKEGEFLLVYPFDALTQDWDTLGTRDFLFWYNKEREVPSHILGYPTPLLIQRLEEHLCKFSNLLGVHLNERIRIYLAGSKDELRELFQSPVVVEGLAYAGARVVGCVCPWSTCHEITHILQSELTGFWPIWLLREGIAEYGDSDGGVFKDLSCISGVREAMREGKLIPLEESIHKEYRGIPSKYDYHVAVALVKFLLEEHGNHRFRELCLASREPSGFVEALEDIYGFTVKELERHWLSWIERYVDENEQLTPYKGTFDLVTDTWNWREIGMFHVCCPTREAFPSEEEADLLKRKYDKHCKTGEVSPVSFFNFYVVDRNALKFLFRTKEGYFRKGNTVADTTFSNTRALFE